MRHNVALTVASLLSMVFMTLHLADDIVRGMEKGGLSNLIIGPILVILLYGTLELSERRSGYVIILMGSLLGAVVPVVHFRGTGGVAAGSADFVDWSSAQRRHFPLCARPYARSR